ncbi:1580_t:CDS:2, partial [Dentiscutata heterogama]
IPMSTNNDNNKQEEIKVVDLLNSRDWSSTCLGPQDSWEPSFKNIMDLCFNSKFSTKIYCGPDLIYIYNQAHVQYMSKSQHPSAFGRPFGESYPEHFDLTKAAYEKIKSTGKGIFEKDRRFIQYNDNYKEEVYVSFAKSPIFKEDGTFWAMLNVSDITTHKVLAKRRIKALSDLANRINDADSLESACHIVMTSIRENDQDIPFALIYLIDNNKLSSGSQPRAARLISTTFNHKDEDLCDEDWIISDNLLETPKTINLMENPNENYDVYIEGWVR